MENFGFSGLWSHVGTTVIAAALGVGDVLLSYLNVVNMPNWAHVLVGLAASLLALYRGKPAAPAV